ncbi:MAG: hypothetical protein Q7O66_19285, partial [Dehalococcoidia bacterium]|nr:hypothetical protein [Dehalococcoidia bacterium]
PRPANPTPTVAPGSPSPTPRPANPTPTVAPGSPSPTPRPANPTPTVAPGSPSPTPRPANPTPTAPAAETSSFGAPAFGTDFKEGTGLVGQATSFPASTKKVVVLFSVKGMGTGTRWGYLLKLNGESVIDKTDEYKWDAAADTNYYIPWTNSSNPLPVGTYDLTLFISNSEVQTGRFTIGAGSTPTPPPADKGVILNGKIVDADTKRGIPEALFVVLKPGSTFAQWEAKQYSKDMVAAYGESGQDGSYRTDVPLARGKTYPICAAADGYKVFIDGSVTINQNDPADVKLKDIALPRE